MKFEYGYLTFDFGIFSTNLDKRSGTFTMLSADGKHKAYSGKLGTLIAQLGDIGWELVSADSAEKGTMNKQVMAVYTFKRRVG